jgi:hypothetical protein
MTVNYLMVTRAGKGLDRSGPSGPTFAQGSGPTTSALTDIGFTDTFASSLSPWVPDSHNSTTGVNGGFNPAVVSGRARMTAPLGANAESYLTRDILQGWNDISVTAEVAPTAVVPGQYVFFTAAWFASVGISAYASFSIQDGNLCTEISALPSFLFTNHGAYNPINNRWLRIAEKNGQVIFSTSPNGTTWTVLATYSHGWADPDAGGNYLSFSAQNQALSGASLEVFVDNVTLQIGSGVIGVPGDLASWQWLFKPKSDGAWQTRDMVAPTGFCDSVYRVVRDPNIFTYDSGNTLGTQVYTHGWVLGETLMSYLAEQNGYGGRPLAWPADGGYKVLPVTGTPVVNDGAGTYGLQSVTWPGSSVGVGTLRQVVSGDEGSTRKVAAILDLLAATTSTQRDTIESTYTSTKAAVDAARANLLAVVSAATDAARRQFYARADLAWFLACQATSAPRGPSLENALLWAMYAVVAKEAGLITGVFTTANYETMTQPTDAVLAMPSGY